jgi:transcriptional regulator with XRE-family HTH domain
MMAELLPRKLRVLRAERGLTLREAAKLTGVAKETLSDLERGLRHPQDLTLAKIAQGYSLPVEELLEVEEAPASPKDLGLPEWVQAPDLEVFGRKISELPTDDLLKLAVELVGGQRTRLLEDLRDRPLSREEAAERASNFARVLIVRDELLRRGEEPPEKFVLAFRRSTDALTPPVEAKRHPREAEPEREVG